MVGDKISVAYDWDSTAYMPESRLMQLGVRIRLTMVQKTLVIQTENLLGCW